MEKTYRFRSRITARAVRPTCWLLTWNPVRFPWDRLQDDLATFQRDGHLLYNWSCGNTKRIEPEDRLFLIRLGREPRGLVASARALSSPYEGDHWDEDEAARGRKSLYTDCRFDTLLDPGVRVFPISRLRAIPGRMHWTPQASGISIPTDVAARLEDEWARFLPT